jgi:hypothetical protein
MLEGKKNYKHITRCSGSGHTIQIRGQITDYYSTALQINIKRKHIPPKQSLWECATRISEGQKLCSTIKLSNNPQKLSIYNTLFLPREKTRK